ncbi:MAG: hypothetical protein GY800_09180 [Planctomycetes bacterium]|nr:hypothetical protein [Planctomycetota bacterium]
METQLEKLRKNEEKLVSMMSHLHFMGTRPVYCPETNQLDDIWDDDEAERHFRIISEQVTMNKLEIEMILCNERLNELMSRERRSPHGIR